MPTFSENIQNSPSASGTVPQLLAMLLGSFIDPRLQDDNTFRHYSGGISTTSPLHGLTETSMKRVTMSVGRASGNHEIVFDQTIRGEWGHARYGIDGSFSIPDNVKLELLKASPKIAKMQEAPMSADFCGLVFQLAAALAHYSVFGMLNCSMIRSGQPIKLSRVDMTAENIAQTPGAIYIARGTAAGLDDGAFHALLAAANAFGVTVYTDYVVLNYNNAAVLSTSTNKELAHQCYSALVWLIDLMVSCDAGDLAAFAFLKGVHSILSVVSHSDEGGAMRSVLRRGFFCPPRGFISGSRMISYGGLPHCTAGGTMGVARLFDGFAIKSAALVALCAPITMIDGRTYPCVYSAVPGRAYRPAMEGQQNAIMLQVAIQHAQQMYSDCSMFTGKYIQGVMKILGISGSTHKGSAALASCFNYFAASAQGDRHLTYSTVAPWYWVEPTGCFDSTWEAEFSNETCPLYGYTDKAVEKPMFEKAVIIESNMLYTTYQVDLSSARKSAILQHLSNNILDGLAHIYPCRFIGDHIGLVRGISASEHLAERHDIAEYLWIRGNSGIIHPAEMLHTQKAIWIKVAHVRDEGMHLVSNHVPTPAEICTGQISCKAHNFTALRVGDMAAQDNRGTLRTRNRAIAALNDARGSRNMLVKSVTDHFAFVEGSVNDVDFGMVEEFANIRVVEHVDVIVNEDPVVEVAAEPAAVVVALAPANGPPLQRGQQMVQGVVEHEAHLAVVQEVNINAVDDAVPGVDPGRE